MAVGLAEVLLSTESIVDLIEGTRGRDSWPVLQRGGENLHEDTAERLSGIFRKR